MKKSSKIFILGKVEGSQKEMRRKIRTRFGDKARTFFFKNYMTIQELLRFDPDVIITCTKTMKGHRVYDGMLRGEVK